MKNFITALPLFDAQMAVHAYRLVTRSGHRLLGSAEDFRMLGESLKTPELDLLKQIGIEPFTGAFPLFAELNKFQLLLQSPLTMGFSPDNFICLADCDALRDPSVFPYLDKLRKSGYKLAVQGMPARIDTDALAGIFNYIILDYGSPQFESVLRELRPFLLRIKLIVINIPDTEGFKKISDIHGILMSGDFYSQPITVGVSDLSPIKMNSLQLLSQINDEDFDLAKTAAVIARDPSLSLSLLRFMNSLATGRHRKIESIRSAVAILGQKEVRKWASVAISVSLADDRPGELSRLSLIRAKFAENLSAAFKMTTHSASLFIAGLLSLLDIILQKPMHEAFREISVDERIRDALVNKRGDFHSVLELIYAYERADWHKTSLCMVHSGITPEVLTQAFLDALLWYKTLLDSIDLNN